MSPTAIRRPVFKKPSDLLRLPGCPSPQDPDFNRKFSIFTMEQEGLNVADFPLGECPVCDTPDVPLSGGMCVRCWRGQR